MLIHGRLLVTEHGFMLDEVKSLLQKSLRRKELDLIKLSAKELTCGKKDQLQWKAIVTFLFEDHCLNHIQVLNKIWQLKCNGDKLGCVEILSRCYTCRHSACLQVVAISEEYRKFDAFWDCKLPIDPNFIGLVAKQTKTINCERLLTCIVKFWKSNDTKILTSLFGLVNMAAKVENRNLTQAGVSKLLDKDVKKPTLHQLVLSILHRYAETGNYMKSLLHLCFRFTTVPEAPQGLIMFSALSQKIYQNTIIERSLPELKHDVTFWTKVGVLPSMPDWAVDKHTYRGKFGKSSAELFKKKFTNFKFSESQLEEFHGERPKVGVPHFFDVGCICNNDILPENPIFEKTKEMYYKQTPKMQKTAKMTELYYREMRKANSVVFLSSDSSANEDKDGENAVKTETGNEGRGKGKKRKNNDLEPSTSGGVKKQKKLSDCWTADATKEKSEISTSSKSKSPTGPLLQLPTGSGKVYTILDKETRKVWKGPYKSKEKMNLCKFYHKAMRLVFKDKHTLEFEEHGQYIIFPLIMSKNAEIKITKRAFYDCIAKQEVSEEDGQFVERHALGLVQLHKLPVQKMASLPVSIWAHFVYRYLLNIGDTGLYNAIATDDLGVIYGIDMEEKRKQVKGDDVINMMFGKLPRKEIVDAIKVTICENIEEFFKLIDVEFDFKQLSSMYEEHGFQSEASMSKNRLKMFKESLERLCKNELGV